MMSKLRQQLLNAGVRRLIGPQNQQLYSALDWESACAAFRQDDLQYPSYYGQDFHGIKGGYLTPVAAVTYDPVTGLGLTAQ